MSITVKNQKQWDLDTGLINACKKRNLTKIRSYLNHGANIDAYNSRGYSPLGLALQLADLSLVKLLVESGCNLAGHHSHLITNLMVAITSKPPHGLSILKYLLSQGFGVNFNQHGRESSLIVLATKEGQLDAVRCLVEHGCNPDIPGYVKDSSALYNSVITKKTDIARFFIDDLGFDKLQYYQFGSNEYKAMVDIMLEKEKIQMGLDELGKENRQTPLASLVHLPSKVRKDKI